MAGEMFKRKDLSVALPDLEERIELIEQSLRGLNTSNNQVTQALQYVLEHLRNLVPLPERTRKLQQSIDDNRTVETLAKASKIFPKTRTVVFVSKGYFGDNVKYAYLAFCDYVRGKGIDAYFLTDDPRQRELLKEAGLPYLSAVPEEWSLADIRTIFGAKVVVLGDNFHAYSFKNSKAYGMLQGAKTVQLWHGIPIKEIGLRYMLRGDNMILDELLASAGEYDMFVAPGEAAREEWAQRFAFREFAASGYPRTDVFFREPAARDLLNVDCETLALFDSARRSGRASIIYTPTYRDDKASNWFGKARIDRFASYAAQKGYQFAVNLHPYEQAQIKEFRAQYPSIRFIASGTDIYPIVRAADMLITDYSSLAFDYLLLDRPLIFYRPAGDEVVVKTRGMIESLAKETPGFVATNVEELIQAAESAAAFASAPDSDPHRAARRELRAKLFDHVDGNAGKRLCEMIVGLVEL